MFNAKKIQTLAVRLIGVGAVNFGEGQGILIRKYMHEKLIKCPNFTWFLPEKNILLPNFGGTCPLPTTTMVRLTAYTYIQPQHYKSINLYLSQAKAHTNTHAHTHTQNTTTVYNKRNKKETVEMKHIYIVRCQIQLTFLTRLFTEQFNLVVRRTRALWSRVEKHGSASSK